MSFIDNLFFSKKLFFKLLKISLYKVHGCVIFLFEISYYYYYYDLKIIITLNNKKN